MMQLNMSSRDCPFLLKMNVFGNNLAFSAEISIFAVHFMAVELLEVPHPVRTLAAATNKVLFFYVRNC